MWKTADLAIVRFKQKLAENSGRLPFDQNFRNFRNGDKWYGNFPGKVPENLEIVEFPKSEPFNRKFRKFWDESQMERKLAGKIFRKFGYTSRGFPLSLEALFIIQSAWNSSVTADELSEFHKRYLNARHSDVKLPNQQFRQYNGGAFQ